MREILDELYTWQHSNTNRMIIMTAEFSFLFLLLDVQYTLLFGSVLYIDESIATKYRFYKLNLHNMYSVATTHSVPWKNMIRTRTLFSWSIILMHYNPCRAIAVMRDLILQPGSIVHLQRNPYKRYFPESRQSFLLCTAQSSRESPGQVLVDIPDSQKPHADDAGRRMFHLI